MRTAPEEPDPERGASLATGLGDDRSGVPAHDLARGERPEDLALESLGKVLGRSRPGRRRLEDAIDPLARSPGRRRPKHAKKTAFPGEGTP
jgi:hypothetical protein